MTALARFIKRTWLRRQHRQDIERPNQLRAELTALRGEEQIAILAAIESSRSLAAMEAANSPTGVRA